MMMWYLTPLSELNSFWHRRQRYLPTKWSPCKTEHPPAAPGRAENALEGRLPPAPCPAPCREGRLMLEPQSKQTLISKPPDLLPAPGPRPEAHNRISCSEFQPVPVVPLQRWWRRLMWHPCQAPKCRVLGARRAASSRFCCLCIPNTRCYVTTTTVCVPGHPGGRQGQPPHFLTVSRFVVSWD